MLIPCSSKVTQSMLPKSLTGWIWSISSNRGFTASLDSLFWQSITLAVNILFLMFKWDIRYFNLCPLLSALSLGSTEKNLGLSTCPVPPYTSSLLLSSLSSPDSISLSSHRRCSSPLKISLAFCQTHSSILMPFFVLGSPKTDITLDRLMTQILVQPSPLLACFFIQTQCQFTSSLLSTRIPGPLLQGCFQLVVPQPVLVHQVISPRCKTAVPTKPQEGHLIILSNQGNRSNESTQQFVLFHSFIKQQGSTSVLTHLIWCQITNVLCGSCSKTIVFIT